MAEHTLERGELRNYVGERLVTNARHDVTPAQAARLADATSDHQWIRADAERAAAGQELSAAGVVLS